MTERERLIKLISDMRLAAKGTLGGMNKPDVWYADYLLEHGVICPPCKVGDTVYCEVDGFEVPLRGRVRNITMFDTGYSFTIATPGYYAPIYTEKDFGCTVFFCPEEAEAALAERRRTCQKNS